MACIVPFMGNAQDFSTGYAGGNPTASQEATQQVVSGTNGISTGVAMTALEQAQMQDALKMEQIKKSRTVDEVSVLKADKVNGKAFSVDTKTETSEALIAIGGQELFHFVLNDPAGAESYGVSVPEFANSAEYLDGMYYVATSTSGMFMQVDPASGDYTTISTGNPYHVIALDPTSGQMYGIIAGSGSSIYTVDVTTGEGTLVAPISATANFFLGFTIDNTGRMFAIDAEIDGVSEINLQTGELISSVPAGFMVNYGQDMATDRELNQVYWAAFNATASAAQLYKVNFDAGEYELVGQFANQASCFATMTVNNPNIPAGPTDFVITPDPNDELIVDLAWTNPSTTIGGDPLTDLTIVVKRNGEVIAEYDPAEIGAAMTFTDDQIPAAGNYRYQVQAINAEGNGGSVGGSVMVGPMCAYTFNLYDTFGDGWNGAAINILNQDGSVYQSVTLGNGASGSIEVALVHGYFSLEWVNGAYDSECSFDIVYPWGEVMVEYASAPAGVFHSWTNDCTPPSCPRPTGVISTNVTDAAATLAWTENGTATTWEIQYGPKGFVLGEGTIVEVTTNPATIEGLESGTQYQAYVRSICGADDISDWSNPTSFATAVACGEGFTAVAATIGNGTSGVYQIPGNAFYNYSYCQQIFTAEELMAQGAFFGEVKSLAFEHFGPTITGAQFTILMANADVADLSGGWYLENMQQVYDGVVNLEQGDGFNMEFIFDTPFVYDGASNIVVTFVYARAPYVGTTPRFYVHEVDFTGSLLMQNDGSPYDPFAPSGNGTAYVNRNNMRFNMCITEPEYVTITGQVTSTLDDAPVADASVKFQGALGSTVVTDENGEYSLDLVQLFNYNVTITAEGFNTYTETVTAPEAETGTFDFAINQPTIAFDPEAVEETAYFMQYVNTEVAIINDGTGELTWKASCIMDDEEKAQDSQAHMALNVDVYNFTLNDPAGATPAGFSHNEFLNAAVYADGVTYYASSTTGQFGIIDYEAGAIELITNNGLGGITYNPATGELIGAVLGANAAFSSVDPSTGATTPLFTGPADFVLGLACSTDGRLFVINAEIDGISEVDMATGEFTTLVTAGFTVNFGQDVEFDHEDGLLYWAAYNADISQAQLYAIDVDDPVMNMIGTFANQTSALAIETISGPGPWLSVEPKSGTVAAGETATFTVTLDGWHADQGTFTGSIEVTNNTVEGLQTVPVTFNILAPECDSPTNFVGEVVDFNNLSLEWTAPAGAIAYNLYYGDEREPFATVEDTYYIDEFKEPGVYTYKVRALYEDGCMSASPEAVVLEAVQPYRVVSGTVTSTLTNEPIEGATITFDGMTYIGARTIVATTAADGTYTANVFVGDYTVTAVAFGYNPYIVNEFAVEDAALTLDFAMEQPQIALSDYEVEIVTGYMNQGIHEMTITNNGTGELTWEVAIETEEEAKSVESVAHMALNMDVYNFTLGDPSGATPAGFSHNEFLNAAVYVDGITYYASSTSGQFGIIDYEAGAIELIAMNGIGGITYNPATGQLIGAVLGGNAAFSIVDPETGATTPLFTGAADFVLGLACSSDGRLFVINADIDGISEVDMATGEFTTLVTGGFTVNYGQDVEFDHEDGLLYWAAFNADALQAQLYAIDINNLEMNMIGTFADQTSALVIETESYSWLVAEPSEGTIAAGETGTFQLVADGWLAEYGTFNAVATISSNAAQPIDVPVTFTINPPACDPVTNPAVEVVDFNDIILTWGAPVNADGVIAYGIYEGDDKVPFAQVDPSEFEFRLDDMPAPNTYYYRIRAIYEDGCVSMSDVLLEASVVVPFGTVYGVVTDSFSGEPIFGATVRFSSNYTTTTDEEGAYSIDIIAGTYENVKISADTYNTLTIESVYVDVYENEMNWELVSKFLPVQNLTGEFVNGAAVLTWEAPVAAKAATEIVLQEGFDEGAVPATWTTIDADGDGENWGPAAGAYGTVPYAGADCMSSASYINYVGPLTPDNWLISPEIPVNGGTLTYYVGAQDEAYPADHYGVYYSVDGTDPSSFELLFEETIQAKGGAKSTANSEVRGRDNGQKQGTWYERNIDLSGINSETVRIAFRHFDCTDNYIMLLDEVSVETSAVAPNEPTGYLVERDGEELAIVTELTYTDNTIESGTYNYCVTAVYDQILSAPVCVEVEAGLLGDANGDGLVNVGDVTTMVAYILQLNPPTFIFFNADMNGDGIINVGDISACVYLIINGKASCDEVAEVQYQIENGILYMNTTAPVSAFQVALSNDDVKALAFDEFITASAMTDEGYVFIAYNFDGKVFEAGTHALFQVNDADVNYFLTSNACGDVSEGRDGAFLGIEDNNNFVAYPNPFNSYVTVSNNVNAEFVVTSITGQVVYKETTSTNFVWTPSNVNSGVYFINVYVDGVNVQTSKVVYQK